MQHVPDRQLLGGVVLEAGEQPVGGEDEQAGVGQRAEQHQHVAVLALAADLVGVHARGLVAMVAVGDQQLGVGERHLQLGDEVLVGGAPERVVACRRGRRPRRTARSSAICSIARPAAPSGSGNRLKMGDRFVRVARVSLRRSSFGPGWVRSCGRIRPGPVLVHAHAREHAGAGAPRAVGRLVVLAQHPDGRLVLAHEHAARAASRPSSRRPGRSSAAGRSRRRCTGCARRAGRAARRR